MFDASSLNRGQDRCVIDIAVTHEGNENFRCM